MSYAVLPVYLTLDVSSSMHWLMGELNNAIERVVSEISTDSIAASRLRLCVISFSHDARIELPLSDVRRVDHLPTLVAHGDTNYSAVFKLLKQKIEEDVATLKHEQHTVLRPLVLFITDGAPVDRDWMIHLGALQDEGFRSRPNMAAFGMGDADPEVLQTIATRREYAFLSRVQTNPGTAIRALFSSLASSMTASGRSVGSGAAMLQVNAPDRFVSISTLIT
ncbi:vWA domain-containing protein [Micromonospora sp. URMC 105]|uniref:vWA domain-containing protein n=1 Tax=Micromonospora sp. URMC 105 TaxID=3423413 RepID=UPI003F1E197A